MAVKFDLPELGLSVLAVGELVEVGDSEEHVVAKGSLPVGLEMVWVVMTATEKFSAELEESTAPVLAERGCIEHGIAAGRDLIVVEDSKRTGVGRNWVVTEL